MAYHNMLEIDPERFRAAFTKRNLSYNEASVFCGFNGYFFSQCAQRKRINLPAAKMLEQFYNIDPDEYRVKPKEETPEDIIPFKSNDSFDWAMLETVIFKAVYEAVKKAWAE